MLEHLTSLITSKRTLLHVQENKTSEAPCHKINEIRGLGGSCHQARHKTKIARFIDPTS